jgi:hypothetical protein
MEAHTVNTLTHKSGDCKPKMFNKYMPSEFSDAFSESSSTASGHYQMEPACCTAGPSTGKNRLGREKNLASRIRRQKKKENSGIFNIPLLSETGSAHKHGDQNPGDFNTLTF